MAKEIELYKEWQYTVRAYESVLNLLTGLNDANTHKGETYRLNKQGWETILRAQTQLARFNMLMDVQYANGEED